jgi:hypothetical protein
MLKKLGFLATALLFAASLFAQVSYKAYLGGLAAPRMTGVGTATLTYTAGSVYNAGHANSIAAGTLTTLGASKTDCSTASIIAGTDACAYIYWPGSGTALAKSNAYGTAAAAGNVVVALVTTDASSLITAIFPASLALPGAIPRNPEFVTNTVATGSSVSLTTATAADVTSISLGAGDWDVWGVVDYTPAASTSITNQTQGISTTSATLGAQDTFSSLTLAAEVPGASPESALPTPVVRLNLSTTTTVYLVAKATFTVSTLKAYGTINARRQK